MSRNIVATMPCKILEVERFADGTPMRCLVAPYGQEWAAIWVWADQIRGKVATAVADRVVYQGELPL